MKLFVKFSIICVVFAFLGCKDKDEHYNIDPTLKPYLELFLNEGKSRGVILNPEEDGLIMKFSELEDPTIGLCTYSDPILVEIDKTYWMETDQYANKEDLRENVVFHELCHGLLNRGHTNATLNNSEWKSLMCGGETFMDRAWNINFSGYRKEYYLNELFNVKEVAPEWSKIDSFSGNKGVIYANMDLSKDYYGEKNNIVYSISDGIYQITRNDNNSNNLNIELFDCSLNEDFYLEISFSCPITSENQVFGISAGHENEEGEKSYHYFFVAQNYNYNDSRYYISHSECMSPFAEVVKPQLQTNKFNHFALCKQNDELFFYVNNELIYRNDYQSNKTFKSFGLIIPGQSTLKANIIQLYSKTGSSSSTKSASTQSFTPIPNSIYSIDNRFISRPNKNK